MRRTKRLVMLAVLSAALILAAVLRADFKPREQGQIYLYGERHGKEKIIAREYELWHGHYHKDGMRHLFLEHSYFTAEFLNLWMSMDSDEILGTFFKNRPFEETFFRSIKSQCPETIFHGTDVGHNYGDGDWLLRYLQERGLEHTEQYRLTGEAIEQGVYYREHAEDPVYRENTMVENFMREFDKLKGESVMGIYGASHTGLAAMNFNGSAPSMANQLKSCYGDAVQSVDLTWLALKTEPDRIDTLLIGRREYEAAYFGKEDLSGDFSSVSLYTHREFWRLEGAYDDFKNHLTSGSILPYDNFPMPVEAGQVFVVDLTTPDGSAFRMYYRSDADVLWNGKPVVVGFFN